MHDIVNIIENNIDPLIFNSDVKNISDSFWKGFQDYKIIEKSQYKGRKM